MPSPPNSPTLSHRRPSVSSNSSSNSKDKPHHIHQASTTADAQEPMQIFVKAPSGETNNLIIPPTTSIATLKSLVAFQQQPNLHESAYPSSNQRLVYAGRHLDDPDKTLRDYFVTPGSTLSLASPLRGGGEDIPSSDSKSTEPTPPNADKADQVVPSEAPSSPPKPAPAPTSKPAGTPKKKGPRCALSSCNALAQRIVGECGFCGGLYCGKHRLLESHSCEGLENAKNQDKERNKEKLEGERTVSHGVLGI